MICANPRAVVVTVIVVLVPGVTEAGLNDALAPVGNPFAENVTVPGNAPPTVAVAIVKFWPRLTSSHGLRTRRSAHAKIRNRKRQRI